MHYDKSPIVEALIDIKTEAPPDLKFEELRPIGDIIGARYPRVETRYLGEGTFSFGAEAKAIAEQKPFAIMFFSPDNKQVFQARIDGITSSRLAPYQSWEVLRDEARNLWEIYRGIARSAKVIRLALRYINQFVLPSDIVEPEHYFKTFPELSRDLPKELRNFGPFSMRLPIPQTDIGGMLLINESLSAPTKPNSISFVLDLDLYVENPAIPDEKGLWAKLEQLRERKNLYFEACITDKTRGLIS
jgi:uncharacterized protein (TIGR04255 family)